MPASTIGDTTAPAVDTILAEDVRLLKLLGAGLCARYTSVKQESTLLHNLSNLPGSSVPASFFRLAESGAAKLAQMVFNLGIVQWGFNTVDKITSRELILLITRSAERIEAQQDDLSTTDLSLVRHLMAFLKDVAIESGTMDVDSEKARRLDSILSSPGSSKSEWLQKEDGLRAQLTMLSAEVDSVRQQLMEAMKSSNSLRRELSVAREETKMTRDKWLQEKQESEHVLVTATSRCTELESTVDKEKTTVRGLELQLAASEVKCSELEKKLIEAQENTKNVTESVGTLMEQLATKTKEVMMFEKLKNEHLQSLHEMDRMQQELVHNQALNTSLMEELKKTEQNLIDVKIFMNSGHGDKLKQTEYALAQSRLELAQCESEKDDLEQEIDELKETLASTLGKNNTGKGRRRGGGGGPLTTMSNSGGGRNGRGGEIQWG